MCFWSTRIHTTVQCFIRSVGAVGSAVAPPRERDALGAAPRVPDPPARELRGPAAQRRQLAERVRECGGGERGRRGGGGGGGSGGRGTVQLVGPVGAVGDSVAARGGGDAEPVGAAQAGGGTVAAGLVGAVVAVETSVAERGGGHAASARAAPHGARGARPGRCRDRLFHYNFSFKTTSLSLNFYKTK